MKTRIGILGGSFNPIHNGHLELAKAVLERGYADEVWLMLSPQNPLKEKSGLLDARLRLEMAKIALEGEQNIRASDFEFSLPRPSYTWRTLDCLKDKYPSYSFSLIIGADNLANFNKWVRPDYILSNYDIIVYPREGYSMEKPHQCKNLIRLDFPKVPWSSTEIREKLSKGEDVSDMIPPRTLEYIRSKHLYS